VKTRQERSLGREGHEEPPFFQMVTDTAPFRYAQYHTAQDVPDRVDFERLARVVSGLVHVVGRFADPPR
jgi:hypothetical protein